MYQLSNEEFRFCKIKKGEKRPFENGWTNKTYTWNDIAHWFNEGNNYGVMCGYGGLIVIDSDDPMLGLEVFETLPPTFRVKTGGGGTHDYFICKGLTKKVILTKDKKHYGEIQSYGSQVVGVGSTHPNGEEYRVVSDRPITEISKNQLQKLIDKFKDSEPIILKRLPKKDGYKGRDVNDIPINQIVNLSGFRNRGHGELIGPNPWHGATGRGNTTYTSSHNLMYCFRCNSCINSATAIGLNEGIISSCSDKLSHEQFLKVVSIAKEKYGLG